MHIDCVLNNIWNILQYNEENYAQKIAWVLETETFNMHESIGAI